MPSFTFATATEAPWSHGTAQTDGAIAPEVRGPTIGRRPARQRAQGKRAPPRKTMHWCQQHPAGGHVASRLVPGRRRRGKRDHEIRAPVSRARCSGNEISDRIAVASAPAPTKCAVIPRGWRCDSTYRGPSANFRARPKATIADSAVRWPSDTRRPTSSRIAVLTVSAGSQACASARSIVPPSQWACGAISDGGYSYSPLRGARGTEAGVEIPASGRISTSSATAATPPPGRPNAPSVTSRALPRAGAQVKSARP